MEDDKHRDEPARPEQTDDHAMKQAPEPNDEPAGGGVAPSEIKVPRTPEDEE